MNYKSLEKRCARQYDNLHDTQEAFKLVERFCTAHDKPGALSHQDISVIFIKKITKLGIHLLNEQAEQPMLSDDQLNLLARLMVMGTQKIEQEDYGHPNEAYTPWNLRKMQSHLYSQHAMICIELANRRENQIELLEAAHASYEASIRSGARVDPEHTAYQYSFMADCASWLAELVDGALQIGWLQRAASYCKQGAVASLPFDDKHAGRQYGFEGQALFRLAEIVDNETPALLEKAHAAFGHSIKRTEPECAHIAYTYGFRGECAIKRAALEIGISKKLEWLEQAYDDYVNAAQHPSLENTQHGALQYSCAGNIAMDIADLDTVDAHKWLKRAHVHFNKMFSQIDIIEDRIAVHQYSYMEKLEQKLAGCEQTVDGKINLLRSAYEHGQKAREGFRRIDADAAAMTALNMGKAAYAIFKLTGDFEDADKARRNYSIWKRYHEKNPTPERSGLYKRVQAILIDIERELRPEISDKERKKQRRSKRLRSGKRSRRRFLR